MKQNSIITLASLVFFLGITACDKTKSNNQESSTATTLEMEGPVFPEGELEASVKKHINQVLNAYNELKAALVATDSEKAQKSGEELAVLMGNFEEAQLSSTIADSYKRLAGPIQEYAQEIAQSEDISSQRTTFSELSNNVYKMVKTFPVNDETLYYTYCPMTFEDGGSYWLDTEKTITNPYFGSEMLNCGTVKETIE